MFRINGTDLIVLLLVTQMKYFVCLVLLLFSCCCCFVFVVLLSLFVVLLLLLVGWLLFVVVAAAAAEFLKIFYPQSTAMLVPTLPMKSRKKLARDVFNAFDTYVDLVYDVTDTAAAHKMAALTVAFFVAVKRRILYKLDQKQSDYIKKLN